MSARITLAVRSEDGNHVENRYVDEMSGRELVALALDACEAGDHEAAAICETELHKRGIRIR